MCSLSCKTGFDLICIDLLKSALFRGGLTNETLQTLLAGEYEALNENELSFVHDQDMKSPRPQRVVANPAALLHESNAFKYESTAVSNVVQPQTHVSNSHSGFNCIPESVEESLVVDDDYDEPNDSSMSRVPFHDQRTILISNLTDNTTHKDLEGIIRGGRLLDLHIRNDRTACISFVEGASEFLSYTKRNDIYLHMKRVSPWTESYSIILTVLSLDSVGQIVNFTFLHMFRTRLLAEQHVISLFEESQEKLRLTRFEIILITYTIL